MNRKTTSHSVPVRDAPPERKSVDDLPPGNASVTQKAKWVEDYVRHYGKVYDKQS